MRILSAQDMIMMLARDDRFESIGFSRFQMWELSRAKPNKVGRFK